MTAARPLSLHLYALACRVASPFSPLLLRLRAARGKEDLTRLGERLGRASVDRPAGRLVWMHAVSVGEALSLASLIEAIRAARPDRTLLITTATRAAAELLAANRWPFVIHQFAPIDTPAAVAGFLSHWRPEIGVLVESELWPNLILEARRRGVTLALVSARMSKSSVARWRRAPRAARAILEAFDLVLARDNVAAAGLEALGARVSGVADLKFGAPALQAGAAEIAALKRAAAGRFVVVGASTHPGEESLILEHFAGATRRSPNRPLLILAPRHSHRGMEIETLARRHDFKTSRRSAHGQLDEADVYIADTLGELGLWYRLANLAIVGGSLVAGVGGHNPLEPARLGCPFVAGPYVDSWPIYAELESAGAAFTARSPEDLGRSLVAAIDEPGAFALASRKAQEFVSARDAAAVISRDRVIALLRP